MSKTIKIIDLLNKIANGEIKEKEIKLRFGAGYYTLYVDEDKIINNANGTGLYILKCLNEEFEILNCEDEIDIDSIEEFEIDKNNFIQTELGAFKTRKMDIAFLNKINELVQAVKQLNKEIKELKQYEQMREFTKAREE
ncbi:MAG: hypothetical protein ACI4UU_00610 [Clostridia bacterium]